MHGRLWLGRHLRSGTPSVDSRSLVHGAQVTQRLITSLRVGDSRDEECRGAVTDVEDAIWIGYASTSKTAKPAREIVVRQIAP